MFVAHCRSVSGRVRASAVSDTARADRKFFAFNAGISCAALTFLAWLLLGTRASAGGYDLRFMPAVNAGLHTWTTLLLIAGWVAVRRGHKSLHQRLMVSAFASSALFLLGYVAYHWVHGDTKFTGTGWVRPVYFAILASHVLLSVAVVPMALAALYFAAKQRFDTHMKVTKKLIPVWLYVSVTGVLIFFMLRGSAPSR